MPVQSTPHPLQVCSLRSTPDTLYVCIALPQTLHQSCPTCMHMQGAAAPAIEEAMQSPNHG